MAPISLQQLDLDDVANIVGSATFARGKQYARSRKVAHAQWDESGYALSGLVTGSDGEIYACTATFFTDTVGPVLDHSECTCPVETNCKHVVAMILGERNARPTATPASWEQTLLPLKTPPLRQPDTAQLGIALTMTPRPSLRILRQGRKGWVNGNLSWSRIGSSYEYDYDQVRLLADLFAVYQARSGYPAYQEVRELDLAVFNSRQLWVLLAEAQRAGIPLLHNAVLHERAELTIDVTAAADGALELRPLVRVGGTALPEGSVAFVGADAHGVVYEAGSTRGLAPLRAAIPGWLQTIALRRSGVRIPPGDVERFVTEYLPSLRKLATIDSSDRSFTVPTISDPELMVRVRYGGRHHVELHWRWRYEIDGDVRLVELEAEEPQAFRDLDTERAVAARLQLPLDDYGLGSRRTTLPMFPTAQLDGMAAMRFTTELLPRLREAVDVEIEGTVPDYREVAEVHLGVSTGATTDTDWFDLDVTITLEDKRIPFVDVFAAMAAGQSHLLTADGAYFALDKPELRALADLIAEARVLQDRADEPLRISRFQAGLWHDLTDLAVVDQQAQQWQAQVQGLLDLESECVPTGLHAQLRPYQLDGFRWLEFVWRNRLGGVLADDMGLGKTLQSLALIAHAKSADPDLPPFLVVAPTSVVPNWAAEAAQFTPGLRAVAIDDGGTLADKIAGADLVVTSYARFRLDFDSYADIRWAGLLLDEAQFVKNHLSKAYRCARLLAAPFKLAITGTPMENNLGELWALLSIVAPGLFPNQKQFTEYYRRPVEKDGDAELLAQLRRRIKPLMLRRTKEQVAADLPDKQEQVLELDLHPEHRRLYETHLQRERQKILGLIEDLDTNRFTILRSLTLLRQLSIDPALVDGEHRRVPSAKTDALLEQLADVIGGGHRALVFSQFTRYLDAVRRRLEADGIRYCYLDGKTKDRAGVLAEFKDGDAPVFLISLKAGGFGLNLTEADYCFLLDPWWNPAAEAQAVDRAHRIGQTRHVMVYRMIAKGTIEEKVVALRERKAQLTAGVLDADNALSTALTADDIRNLLM